MALVGAAIALMVVVWAAFTPPSWWRDRHDPAPDAAAIAEALESGLVALATKVRTGEMGDGATQDSARPPSREWAVRLDEAQLNAWLATRLPAWLAHRGEQSPPTARVRVRAGHLDVALRRAEDPAVISVSVRARVEGEAIRLRPVSATIGRMPVPLTAIRSLLAPTIAAMSDEKLDGVGLDSIDLATHLGIELGDGRRVEFVDIEFRRGEVRLRARTSSVAR